jgi:hypothetical protein
VTRYRLFVLPAAVAAAALVSTVSTAARAQAPTGEQQVVRDQPASQQGFAKVPTGDKDPLRGSTFLFDQSITTATADAGLVTPQSQVPFYGWWLSLRPRWNFNDKLRLQGRFDFYKEFTNSQDTTLQREDVFGDIWTDLIYSTPLATEGRWKDTKVSVGARVLWPTSKVSIDQGIYFTAGATAGLSQKFTLKGPDAPVLNSARAGLTFAYLHPFSDSTTPNSPNFAYTRENVEGFSFVSHQLSGQTLSNHTLYGILDTGIDITPKLSATLDFILINQWHYAPPSACITITTGPVCPPRINDQQFTQESWFVLQADYEIIPELSLGLGYYNLANTIAPDGTVRTLFGGGDHSLLWSPDARFYFDITANLDKIYEAATGRYKSTPPGKTAAAARTARQERILNEIR